jgi:hypothetical protein
MHAHGDEKEHNHSKHRDIEPGLNDVCETFRRDEDWHRYISSACSINIVRVEEMLTRDQRHGGVKEVDMPALGHVLRVNEANHSSEHNSTERDARASVQESGLANVLNHQGGILTLQSTTQASTSTQLCRQ